MKHQAPPITAEQFDRDIARPQDLWGASTIAAAINVSVDVIYKWAKNPDIPIYRPGGQYYADRQELRLWLKSK